MQEEKDAILKEAIRIADELVEEAIEVENKCYWKSISMDGDRKITSHIVETIYSGVSGIALFLLRTHIITKDIKYLSCSEKAMKWLEGYCLQNPTLNYAFFTGRTGVSYTFLQFYQHTGKKKYLETAAQIADQVDEFILNSNAVDDLINGSSGTLLGLLHLHSYTNDSKWLKSIDLYISRLIDASHSDKKGLYWDRTHQIISGLCGFSHGAAGIGYVFLELSNYFNNPAFLWLANQAFEYENQNFNPQTGNWKDLRKGAYTEQDLANFKKKYMEEEFEFFTSSGDMNAWCHGAAGISLARTRAHLINSSGNYLKDILRAIKKTIQTDLASSERTSATLCHGSGGNAEVFIESYLTLNDGKYIKMAEELAFNCIKERKRKGFYSSGYSTAGKIEDTSLFMGKSGIGYFYLRTLFPSIVPSVLRPDVISKPTLEDISSFPNISIKLEEIKRRIIEKKFTRTLKIAEALKSKKTAMFFRDNKGKDLFQDFDSLVKEIKNLSSQENKAILIDFYKHEKDKLKLDKSIKSNSLTYISEKMREERIPVHSAVQLQQLPLLKLKLSSLVTIKVLKHSLSWSTPDEISKEYVPVLIKATSTGVIEEELSYFSMIVLKSFEKPQLIEEVITKVFSEVEPENDDESNSVREAVIVQVYNALAGGIIEKA